MTIRHPTTTQLVHQGLNQLTERRIGNGGRIKAVEHAGIILQALVAPTQAPLIIEKIPSSYTIIDDMLALLPKEVTKRNVRVPELLKNTPFNRGTFFRKNVRSQSR